MNAGALDSAKRNFAGCVESVLSIWYERAKWMSFLYKKSNLFIVDQQIQPNKREVSFLSFKNPQKRASESVDPSEQSSPQPPYHIIVGLAIYF